MRQYVKPEIAFAVEATLAKSDTTVDPPPNFSDEVRVLLMMHADTCCAHGGQQGSDLPIDASRVAEAHHALS